MTLPPPPGSLVAVILIIRVGNGGTAFAVPLGYFACYFTVLATPKTYLLYAAG